MTSKNQIILRNTVFLYIRMLLVMIVSLYTSRIVLQTLGVEDFGIYSVVGGVVTLLSFLNGALSNSTARFLAFELGKGTSGKIHNVFSITLSIHVVLSIIIIVLAETIGLWFFNTKLVIPPERFSAAVWVYHFSVLSIAVSIIQTPYQALIIAQERMQIFAYVSVVEVGLRLGLVCFLVMAVYDKLVIYAALMFIATLIVTIIYFGYCFVSFKESRYSFVWDSLLVHDIFCFSGWSLAGSFAYALVTQGSSIVLNLFFGPVVNASKEIATQINIAVNSFVMSFRTAANPQIVKLYAEEKNEEMKWLILNTTKFSFFLVIIFEIPLLLETEQVLRLWLGEIPEYSVLFVRLTLLDTMVSIFDVSLFSGLVAINRIKENAIISPVIGFCVLPISYIMYKIGFSVECVFYVIIVKSTILSFCVKPYLLCKFSIFKRIDFFNIFFTCLLVLVIGSIPAMIIYKLVLPGFFRFFMVVFVSFFSVVSASFFVGIDAILRRKIIDFLKSKWGVFVGI